MKTTKIGNNKQNLRRMRAHVSRVVWGAPGATTSHDETHARRKIVMSLQCGADAPGLARQLQNAGL